MATFTVFNTDDSGLGSLRQAIEDANTTAGFDTIEFDEELSGQEIILTSGELQITDDLTINGLGAEELTISGKNNFSVFRVDNENFVDLIDVVINELTIADAEGIGINNSEKLILNNSTISDNNGIGIRVSYGDLEVTDSTISGNNGEGIDASNVVGSIEKIPDGTISFSSGDIEVTNSTISGNSGSGISLFYGGVELTNSTISDNGSSGIGGAFTFAGVTNSNISGNNGNGIGLNRGRADVTNSTISDNEGTGIFGGRFVGSDVRNSTISGNSNGGLKLIYGSSAEVTNSTITGNTTDDGGGAGIFLENRNDYYSFLAGSALVENTIIAGNFDNSSAESDDLEPDVSGNNFTSRGYNIIGDGTGSNGFDDPSDQVGTSFATINPLLAPLQDNGGFTKTHALLTGSPAIDAGNPDFEPPPEFEQRGVGFPRVLDGDGDGTAIVDIGAFEFNTRVINGTENDDELMGTSMDDTINGLGGNDLLLGDKGNDRLDGGAGDDTLEGGKGNDTLLGGENNDLLNGDRDADLLNEGNGDDTLLGGGQSDLLDGRAGNDSLVGGRKNDTLRGGLGDDTLRGDANRDTFVLARGEGTDVIEDFNLRADRIGLADGLTVAELTFDGNNILFGAETLAELNIPAATLSESNFTIV